MFNTYLCVLGKAILPIFILWIYIILWIWNSFVHELHLLGRWCRIFLECLHGTPRSTTSIYSCDFLQSTGTLIYSTVSWFS